MERWNRNQPHIVKAGCIVWAHFDVLCWELTHSKKKIVLISSNGDVSSNIITWYFAQVLPLHPAIQASRPPAAISSIAVGVRLSLISIRCAPRVHKMVLQESDRILSLDLGTYPVMVLKVCVCIMYQNTSGRNGDSMKM